MRKTELRLTYKPYFLNLRHEFSVAWGSRKSTPVVLTRVEYDGYVGFGEASLPPYLGESQESVLEFLKKVDITRLNDVFDIESVITYLDTIAPDNFAAKASVDIAMHDLKGKLLGKPWFRIWGLDPLNTPFTSFTIGIDSANVVREKVLEAANYRILKVKLGGANDREMINTIRSLTDKPLYVDANGGWTDRNFALDLIHWLKEQNVILVEQPMPDSMEKDIEWLVSHSPLPIFADESIKTINDLREKRGLYHGVNIKLMKCGGMHNAYKMSTIAREAGMKVMIGCMTETSCAVSAAAQLSPSADFADLDGNLLITNDCFDGVRILEGKVSLSGASGIGVKEKKKFMLKKS